MALYMAFYWFIVERLSRTCVVYCTRHSTLNIGDEIPCQTEQFQTNFSHCGTNCPPELQVDVIVFKMS